MKLFLLTLGRRSLVASGGALFASVVWVIWTIERPSNPFYGFALPYPVGQAFLTALAWVLASVLVYAMGDLMEDRK